MDRKKTLFWLLALPCAAALVLAQSAMSGQSAPQTSPPPDGGMMSTPSGGGTMMSPRYGMQRTPAAGTRADQSRMERHSEMMARMEEANRRLDDLVSKMNSATGEAKIDAIAAVVNELAAQHRQMHEHMMAGGGPAMHGKEMGGARRRGAASTTPRPSTSPSSTPAPR